MIELADCRDDSDGRRDPGPGERRTLRRGVHRETGRPTENGQGQCRNKGELGLLTETEVAVTVRTGLQRGVVLRLTEDHRWRRRQTVAGLHVLSHLLIPVNRNKGSRQGGGGVYRRKDTYLLMSLITRKKRIRMSMKLSVRLKNVMNSILLMKSNVVVPMRMWKGESSGAGK